MIALARSQAEHHRARFESFLSEPDSNGCIHFMGYRDRYGYGKFAVNGQPERAHRFSLILSGVELRPGQLCLHRCDVPSCVNPSHLFVGTHKDNTRDMMLKGRARFGSNAGVIIDRFTVEQVIECYERHGSLRRAAEELGCSKPGLHKFLTTNGYEFTNRALRGCEIGTAVVDEVLVKKIRERYAQGVSQRIVGKEFGVTQGLVSRVVRRVTWAWVE